MTFSGAGFRVRLRRDPMLRLQAAIAVLTVIGAVMSAISAWFKSTTSSSATSWDQHTAAIVLIVAAVLAGVKFYKEWKEL